MRIHSAAAFLLARGLGPTSTNQNEFALDLSVMSPMKGVTAIPKAWGRSLAALKMTPTDDPVAGAFNNLNADMQKHHADALETLKELSDSFKKLAEADLTGLFDPLRGTNLPSVVPAVLASSKESLDTTAPLAGDTFSPPTHRTSFYSDSVAPTPAAGASYLESLKQAAKFPEPASSYLESMSAASTPTGPTKSYRYTSSATKPQTGAFGSSYLNAISSEQSVPTQGYASSVASATAGSYLDALQGVAGGSPVKSPPPAYQSRSYLDSIAGSVSYDQAVPKGSPYLGEPVIAYADPSTPLDVRVVDFAMDNEDAMRPGRATRVQEPVSRVRTVQLNPGFDPDMDWNPETQRRAPPPPHSSNDRISVGAQRISSYIPGLQGGQGMNGASNVPEPKPKVEAPRPVFSKKISGIHSDFDEMINPGSARPVATPANIFNPYIPKPAPKAPMPVFAELVSGIVADNGSMMNPGSLVPEPNPRMSVSAQRVKDIPDWQSDFPNPPLKVEKPMPPVSVFAKKVNGIADFDAPPAYSRPEPPRSIFSQKIRGVADFNSEPPAQSRPEPPMSVFAQKINGVAAFNDGPSVQHRKPEPPMSVFSQRIRGVADFSGPPPTVPKPEPPRSIFAQKIASNVPRSVVASSVGDMEAFGNVPTPNPRWAPQQNGWGGGGFAASSDFGPDFEDAMAAGAPMKIPIPEYSGPNHVDQLTRLDRSFMVTADDRFAGKWHDEYLR